MQKAKSTKQTQSSKNEYIMPKPKSPIQTQSSKYRYISYLKKQLLPKDRISVINDLGIIDNLHDFSEIDRKYGYFCFNSLQTFLQNIMEYDISTILSDKQYVNTPEFKKEYFKFIQTKFEPTYRMALTDLKQQIRINFDNLFNVTYGDHGSNINNLISDNNNKIKLRHQLYYYIKTGDETILENLLQYMNFDQVITNEHARGQIKQIIRTNRATILPINNITYPVAYMEDTTRGVEEKIFNYRILNLDKENIDEAHPTSIFTYFGKGNEILVDNKTKTVGVNLDEEYKLEYLEGEVYLKKDPLKKTTTIVTKYKNIEFNLKSNKVGRKKGFGIYQTTYLLLKLFEQYFDINHPQAAQAVQPAQPAQAAQAVQADQAAQEEDDDVMEDPEAKEKVKEDSSITVARLTKVIKEISTDNDLIGFLTTNPEINEIIDTSNVFAMFNRLYDSKEIGKEIGKGCIVFLLFGAKRYGDWVQVHMAKKNYFMLRTFDEYCEIYAYLYGVPLIMQEGRSYIAYSYIPPDNLNYLPLNYLPYKLVNKDAEEFGITHEILMNHTSFRDPKTEFTSQINRYYFNKYKKYKYKYHMLKKYLYDHKDKV
jgi:hypothetical protein